jgi:hypothetical protein
VEFSGAIAALQDPNAIGDGSIGVGTPFAGSLMFDTHLSDQFERPDLSRFNPAFDAPVPFEFSVTLGSTSFLVNLPILLEDDAAAEITIQDGLPSAAIADVFDLSVFFPTPTPPGVFAERVRANLVLTAPGGRTLSSNALTQVPFDLAAFPDARLIFEFAVRPRPGDNMPCCILTAEGRIDRLRVVPEPGAAGLLAMGLALLARRRRR